MLRPPLERGRDEEGGMREERVCLCVCVRERVRERELGSSRCCTLQKLGTPTTCTIYNVHVHTCTLYNTEKDILHCMCNNEKLGMRLTNHSTS